MRSGAHSGTRLWDSVRNGQRSKIAQRKGKEKKQNIKEASSGDA